MTASTEQERAEVIYTDQGINVVKDGVLIVFIPWEQAARRAQVVPQQYSDWRIDSTAGCDILVYKDCSVIEDGQAHWVLSIIRAALAAAPQQPEAMPGNPTLEAPVQIPEPDGYIMDSLPDGRLEFKRGPLDHMDSLVCSTRPVYEWDTVRKLLADQAAKENP